MTADNAKQSINEHIDKMQKDYQKKKEAIVNIAISGQSGAGKSSLINAIVGKKVAEVGSTETTMEIKKYESNGIHFSDLPGCGTLKFPKDTYIDNCKIGSFDAVIIVTANRFMENDFWLISEMVRLGRPIYLVRTKMDEAISNEMNDNGLTEYQTYEKVKSDIKNNIKSLVVSGIYLTTSRNSNKFDLPKLLIDVSANLDKIKRIRFLSDIAPLNKEILEDKKILAKDIVSYSAWASAANGLNPVPGLDISVDVGILVNMGKQISNIYGLSESSIKYLSAKMGSPASKISLEAKGSAYLAKFVAKEGVIILLKRLAVSVGSKTILKYIPFVGQAIAAGIGYKLTDSFGETLIKESNALAEEILSKCEQEIVK